jgi:hypothetical protein
MAPSLPCGIVDIYILNMRPLSYVIRLLRYKIIVCCSLMRTTLGSRGAECRASAAAQHKRGGSRSAHLGNTTNPGWWPQKGSHFWQPRMT